MEKLIEQVTTYVVGYMSQFDASHDFHHIERVFDLAKTIEARERKAHPQVPYRAELITLAALLHDVGDRKYLQPGQDGSVMVAKVLTDFGASDELAQDVQTIVNHVSYKSEIKDLSKVQECLRKYPELGIVQDADRLDAIGAVGVARCFAYNSAAGYKLQDAIQHFEDKLVKLESMMKTDTGRELAAVKTKRLLEFKAWWDDEVSSTQNIDRVEQS